MNTGTGMMSSKVTEMAGADLAARGQGGRT